MITLKKIIKLFVIAFIAFMVYSLFSISNSIFLQNSKELKSYIIEPFDTLDINTMSSKIEIVSDDKYLIETDIDSKNIINNNNSLVINEQKKIFFNNSSNIIIHIPKNTSINNFNIETGGGIITINDFVVENLNIEMGAGKILFNNVSILNNSNIELGAGYINLNDGINNNSNIELGVGKLYTSSFMNNNSINCGIGSLEINGLKEEYKISFQKGIGSIKVNKNEVTNSYGNGNNIINLSIGIGTINIK